MSASAPLWASIAACTLLVPVFGAPAENHAPTAAVVQLSATSEATSTGITPLVDGDCTKILNPAAVALSLSKSKKVVVTWGDPLLASVGGIDCSYSIGTEYENTAAVYLQVVPAAIVDQDSLERSITAHDCSSQLAGDDKNNGCRVTATVGGWWYNLAVYGLTSTGQQRAGFLKIVPNLEKALKGIPAPSLVDGSKKFTCDAVNTGGIPVTQRRTLPGSWSGNDVTTTELYAAAFLLSGPTTCRFTMPSGKSWDVTVYPGGSALFYGCGHFTTADNYPGPSSTIVIAGVKSTYGKVATDAGPLFCSTDGTSTVSVSGDYDIVLNAKARAAIGKILVSVLAAAS